MKQFGDSIETIELSENHGFTGGYNRGLKSIDADLYILLNSDVKVAPDWIEPLVESMKDSNIGAVQPKILSYKEPNKFEYAGAAGGMLDSLGFSYSRGRIIDIVEEDKRQYDQPISISWASGAALCIRPKLFHGLGGFDESYFAHFEEIDLCWKIRRSGYDIKCIPSSVVYHLGGGTLNYQSPRKLFLNYRNNLSTIIKNENWHKLLWLVPMRFGLEALSAYMYLFKGKISLFWAIAKAHFAVIGRFPKLISKAKSDDLLIKKLSIGASTEEKSTYTKSIIVDYYLKKKKYFTEIYKRK